MLSTEHIANVTFVFIPIFHTIVEALVDGFGKYIALKAAYSVFSPKFSTELWKSL